MKKKVIALRKTDLKYYLNFLFPVFFGLILFLLGSGAISLKQYGIPFSMGGSINRLIFFCFFLSMFIDRENREPLSGKAEIFAYLYIIWFICAGFFQDIASDAIPYLLNLLLFPITFLLGMRMAAFPKYSRVVFFLIAGGAVISVLRTPLSDVQWFVMDGVNRFSGSQGHPNFSGFYYALTLLLSLNIILTRKISPFLKICMLPASFILIRGLLNTYSRSSWAGAIVALFLSSLFWLANSKRLSFSWLITFIFILLIAGVAIPFDRTKISVRAGEIMGGEIDESSRERIYCWSSSWDLIKKHPLTGIGAGNERFKKHYISVRKSPAKLLLPHPHNQFFYLAVAAGIPGLLLFFMIILTVLAQIFKNLTVDDQGLWVSSLTAFGVIICIFIAGIFDSFFISARLNALFGALLALAFNNRKAV